jgi:addiction module toxin, relE/stbE family
MGFRIEISEKLNKKIKKMDKNVQKMLYSYIVKNLKDTDNPRKNGKVLKGNLKGLWRYRVMDYRLIVDIQDDKLVIIAIDFAHRREIYK